jgi:hypothetical protein
MRRQPAAASGYWLVPRAGCWPARSAPVCKHFAFDSFRVWVGDELNGFDAMAEIRPGDPAWSDDVAIAHWLHQTAISL